MRKLYVPVAVGLALALSIGCTTTGQKMEPQQQVQPVQKEGMKDTTVVAPVSPRVAQPVNYVTSDGRTYHVNEQGQRVYYSNRYDRVSDRRYNRYDRRYNRARLLRPVTW